MRLPKLPFALKTKPKSLPPGRTRLRATARRATAQQPMVDEGDEEPNMKLSSALLVMLVLHVVAVGGIYAFNSIKAHKNSIAAVEAKSNANHAAMAAASESEAAAVEETGNVHTVKAGETLGKIASMYGTNLAHLEELNGLQNVAILRVGQTVRLPAYSAPVETQQVEAPSRKVAQLEPRTTTPAPAPKVTAPKQSVPPVAATTTKPAASKPIAAEAKPVAAATKPVAATTTKPAPVKKTAPEAAGKSYTVGKGENPVLIAKKLGVKYDELLKLNKIDDPKKLRVGQVLKVPPKQ